MAHAERAGAEAGNGAARFERIAGDFAAMKSLEPVADRIGKDDQVLDPALLGERAGSARHVYS